MKTKFKRLLLLLLPALLWLTLCPAAAEDGDGVLISDCASGWHCDGGATYSKNTSDTTDGNACSVASFRTGFFFFLVHTGSAQGGTFDMTDARYIEMDLWVDDVNVFRNAADCRMDIGPDGNVDAWNVKVSGNTLRALTLEEGWNHVFLELSGMDAPNYDLTTANVIRFYAIGLSDEARELRIDNMRAVTSAPEESAPSEEISTEPDYYTFGTSEDTRLDGAAASRRPAVIAEAEVPSTEDPDASGTPSDIVVDDDFAVVVGVSAFVLCGLTIAVVVVLRIRRKGGKSA